MRPLYFDDQPLEPLLYGAAAGQAAGPSQASVYAAAIPWVETLRANLDTGALAACRENLLSCMNRGVALPPSTLLDCVRLIGSAWRDIPCPRRQETDFPSESILEPIFDVARRDGPTYLARECGDALVRCHESLHDLQAAANVMQDLLNLALREKDLLEEARCSNNLGFELNMLEEFSKAKPLLERAVTLFNQLGAQERANNARANLLVARFHLFGLPEAVILEPEIREVWAFYSAHGDNRERKLLRVMARFAHYREDLPQAIATMERAVSLGEDTGSWLVDVDRAYLNELKKLASGED